MFESHVISLVSKTVEAVKHVVVAFESHVISLVSKTKKLKRKVGIIV